MLKHVIFLLVFEDEGLIPGFIYGFMGLRDQGVEGIKFLTDLDFVVDGKTKDLIFLEEERVLGVKEKFEVFDEVFCVVTKVRATFDQEVIY